MGYLSQKKHAIRENIFFIAASVVMSFLAVALLINPEFVFLGFNLFHFYCLSILLAIGAVYSKRVIPSIVLLIVLIITYTLISISGNIFLSDKFKGEYTTEIEFGKESKFEGALNKGIIISGDDVFASYALINEEAPLMLIKVDMKDLPKRKYSGILRNLQKFVMQQDVEVVVYGDFGMPEWSKLFRRFTEVSGLTVKNRLIFDSFFAVPHFYMLGYNNVGINDLKVSNGEIKIKISYDIL